MIISPVLLAFRSTVPSIKLLRCIRSSIRQGKDTFQITIDVHKFSIDEIRVKARPEHVIIEGKQERKGPYGFVVRQFIRKFKLPSGCSPKYMRSDLSPEGMLTITAQRKGCDTDAPCETLIPVCSASETPPESFVNVQPLKSPKTCEKLKDPPPTKDEKTNSKD